MSTIRMNRGCGLGYLLAAGLGLAGSAALAAGAASHFGSGDEGWMASGDASSAAVTWRSTGGNPGGNIEIIDAVLGGVTFFDAPAKFLGNQLATFGQTLSFDLMQHITGNPDQFNFSDVVLSGGGLTLALDTASNPAFDAWTHYNVALSSGAWRLNDLSGAFATNAQIKTVLGSLSGLHIRAEYQTGPDTGSLDNVVLGAVPESSTAAMLALGLACLGVVARRRRG